MTDYPVNIAGTWVTSFNNWFQNEATDLPQLFRIINNRIIGWTDPVDVNNRFDHEYFTHEDDDETNDFNYLENDATRDFAEEYEFLTILNPVPVATLSCFKFRENMTFDLWVRFNNLQLMQDWSDVTGYYDFTWHQEFGTYGGTITVRNPDRTTHATLKYLLVSPDELNFIMAYKDDPEDAAPSGAGTMRRVNVPPPIGLGGFGGNSTTATR